MAVWLLLDVSNLAYRAFHTTGGLEYGGEGTGVLYGLFRDVLTLTERFGADGVAFFFDSMGSRRRGIYPQYKAKRRELSEGERAAHLELHRQLDVLRTGHLPRIGYRNVFHEQGFEADDLIAAACMGRAEMDEAVIVSTDEDLWQLLDERVLIWNPVRKRTLTAGWFRKEHGIEPYRWAVAKAIAGCPGDGVPGVRGVGMKTACKYIRGGLKRESKAWQAIERDFPAIRDRNVDLVWLPLIGTPEVRLVEDKPNVRRWNEVMGELGIGSLPNMTVGRGR